MQQLKSSENCITDGEYYLCVCVCVCVKENATTKVFRELYHRWSILFVCVCVCVGGGGGSIQLLHRNY